LNVKIIKQIQVKATTEKEK